MIDDILEFNKKFVESKGYEKYITNKYPDKKIAILSCMDTRLTELLPAALGIRNGDVKIIKNAGGVISHPFGSVIRSLMVAIYELGVKEVMVVYAGSVELANFGRRLFEQQFLGLESWMITGGSPRAKERYLTLLEENPELLQYVPLKHIASYLWITPQSLSRIRAELGRRKKDQ